MKPKWWWRWSRSPSRQQIYWTTKGLKKAFSNASTIGYHVVLDTKPESQVNIFDNNEEPKSKSLTPIEREDKLKRRGYSIEVIRLVQECTHREADHWTAILCGLDVVSVRRVNMIHDRFLQLERESPGG